MPLSDKSIILNTICAMKTIRESVFHYLWEMEGVREKRKQMYMKLLPLDTVSFFSVREIQLKHF